MSRRPAGTGRRFTDSGGFFPFSGSSHSKSKSSPLLYVALILVGAVVLICIAKGGSGFFSVSRDALSKVEGDFLCTLEVQRAISVLKKVYGDSMRKVLHVGPDTCSVVSMLIKEDETEAWGVEPYDIEDADASCKGLVRKGLVRVADIKFPLPYRPKSFSLVIVSDALDYLSPKYLNKTLPDLARVSADGLIAFTGLPGRQKAKVAEVSKFGRPVLSVLAWDLPIDEGGVIHTVSVSSDGYFDKMAKMRSSSWWVKYFMQMSLEDNEAATKKFEQAASKMSYKLNCQVFHLKSYH